jgi:hypothetical protein
MESVREQAARTYARRWIAYAAKGAASLAVLWDVLELGDEVAS